VSEYEWKEGQEVVVNSSSSWGRPARYTKKIDRITPTGVIVIGSTKFDPRGWEKTSDKWHKEHIEPATKALLWEIRAEVRQYNLIAKFRHIKPENLKTSQLERILEIAEEGKP